MMPAVSPGPLREGPRYLLPTGASGDLERLDHSAAKHEVRRHGLEEQHDFAAPCG